MKKKEEIAVKITDKNREKVRGILEMFNQWCSHDSFRYNYICFFNGAWYGNNTDTLSGGRKLEVIKPKELRNILAVEHLKAGDVVVCESNGFIAVGVFNEWGTLFGFDLENCHCKDGGFSGLGICFDNFLRYATEEEKALLEPASITYKGKPVKVVCNKNKVDEDYWEINFTIGSELKKELEVGKWYFGELDNERKTLFCFNGEYGQFTQYGFNVKGGWSNQIGCIQGFKYTKATPQEVEEALIKEAKSRGIHPNTKLTIDTTTIYNHGAVRNVITKDNCFRYSNNHLEILTKNGAYSIFKDGKWVEIVNTKPNVINMYRLVKGSKCVRQFDEKQKDSLINNGWKEVTQEEVIDLLFKK